MLLKSFEVKEKVVKTNRLWGTNNALKKIFKESVQTSHRDRGGILKLSR